MRLVLAGLVSPIANSASLAVRHAGARMKQHVVGVRDVSVDELLTDILKLLGAFPGQVVAPWGEVEVPPRPVNISSDDPGKRSNRVIPGHSV